MGSAGFRGVSAVESLGRGVVFVMEWVVHTRGSFIRHGGLT